MVCRSGDRGGLKPGYPGPKIGTRLHERAGKAIANFAHTMPRGRIDEADWEQLGLDALTESAWEPRHAKDIAQNRKIARQRTVLRIGRSAWI